MAVATVVVAWQWELPLRDPDGVVVPTYVRLPLIVLGALALDVVPRAVLAARRGSEGFGSSLVTVTRERWPREQVVFALTGVVAWYVTYAAFRNLKSYVPFVNDRLWDTELARLDQLLWFGQDPAAVLHDLLGTGWMAHFMSAVYIVWIGIVPVTLAVALVWSRHRSAGAWYVTAVAVDWLLGVATYFMLPTLGPIYSSPETFDRLPRTDVTTLQEWMLADRVDVLADPFATQAVQTIAAFASLHVGVMVTICLVAELLRLPRSLRAASWVFLLLTVVSTVYFGWHFFVDALGGAVLGAAGVVIAAWATGNSLRPISYRERALEDQPDAGESSAARSRSA